MYTLHDTQPFAVDPFNEAGILEKERNSLLIRDFLSSYEALSSTVSEKINGRYHRMSRDF